MRRRAGALVSILLGAWLRRAAKEEADWAGANERAREVTHAAGALEARSDDLAANLAESLEPHAQSWARDADLIFVGRSGEASRDPAIMRYRVDRALAALAPALTRALASLAPEAGVAPADLLPGVRSIVRAAVEASPFDAGAIVRAMARAGIAMLVDGLFAASTAARVARPAEGVVCELRAFAAVLGRPPNPS